MVLSFIYDYVFKFGHLYKQTDVLNLQNTFAITLKLTIILEMKQVQIYLVNLKIK